MPSVEGRGPSSSIYVMALPLPLVVCHGYEASARPSGYVHSPRIRSLREALTVLTPEPTPSWRPAQLYCTTILFRGNSCNRLLTLCSTLIFKTKLEKEAQSSVSELVLITIGWATSVPLEDVPSLQRKAYAYSAITQIIDEICMCPACGRQTLIREHFTRIDHNGTIEEFGHSDRCDKCEPFKSRMPSIIEAERRRSQAVL